MPTTAELGARVQEVLSHLYDSGYLQRHPLTDYLQPGNQLGLRERMRYLRTLMLELIEELNPGPEVPFRSARARVYSVVNLHYVEGMTVQEAARELAISERQFYRDLRRAEQTLTEMLADRAAPAPAVDGDAIERNALLLEELGRLEGSPEEASLAALMEGAAAAVRSLCQQRGVAVRATPCAAGEMIYIDPLLARQVLVSMLSWAVQGALPGTAVHLATRPAGGGARFEVRYAPSPDASRLAEAPAALRGLAHHLGGSISVDILATGQVCCQVAIGDANELTVLVVDDNAGMLELFQRYLADQRYRLIGAQNGNDGLRLAAEQQPDVIILDVMMPRQDGWEVLQVLQNREATRGIPVIVCSVLEDPELALSLGAVEFLPKPVSRSRLLAALARLAAHSPAR